MILPRSKQDLLSHPLVNLEKETCDFIGKYLDEFIEEIKYFIDQNNLDWVIKDHDGKAYIIAENCVPIKNESTNVKSETATKSSQDQEVANE